MLRILAETVKRCLESLLGKRANGRPHSQGRLASISLPYQSISGVETRDGHS